MGRNLSKYGYYYIFRNPNATVKETEHLFDKQWNVLEVGCGEGQNALYLAKQGFENVDAFDVSENGINKLRKYKFRIPF